MTYPDIIARLKELADPEKVLFKQQKFGVVSNNALGVMQTDLNKLAKEIGYDQELALQLFDSGIYEGRLLCSKIFRPKWLTVELMEKWVKTFENWEVCDSFSMAVFAKSELALPKIMEWTKRSAEFEKRAGFAIMAAYCSADKKADNTVFEGFLPIILREACDDRIYVKKAVNWALRSIGKRNIDLNKKAITTAEEIALIDHKAAQWIAKDALKELQGEKVRISDYPREKYRVK